VPHFWAPTMAMAGAHRRTLGGPISSHSATGSGGSREAASSKCAVPGGGRMLCRVEAAVVAVVGAVWTLLSAWPLLGSDRTLAIASVPRGTRAAQSMASAPSSSTVVAPRRTGQPHRRVGAGGNGGADDVGGGILTAGTTTGGDDGGDGGRSYRASVPVNTTTPSALVYVWRLLLGAAGGVFDSAAAMAAGSRWGLELVGVGRVRLVQPAAAASTDGGAAHKSLHGSDLHQPAGTTTGTVSGTGTGTRRATGCQRRRCQASTQRQLHVLLYVSTETSNRVGGSPSAATSTNSTWHHAGLALPATTIGTQHPSSTSSDGDDGSWARRQVVRTGIQ